MKATPADEVLEAAHYTQAFCEQMENPHLAQAWINGVGLTQQPWTYPQELGAVVLFGERGVRRRTQWSAPHVEFIPEGPYKWTEHEGYVDFANAKLGGGIFGKSFVQEEKHFMFETNALPVLWQSEHSARARPNALQRLRNARSLHERPALIRMRRLFSVKNTPEGTPGPQYYGELGYKHVIGKARPGAYNPDPSWLDLPRRHVDFVAICMAAATRKELAANRPREIGTMLRLATEGFQQFIALCDENPHRARIINTGNWGCGAFGGDTKLMYLVQLLAYLTALRVSDVSRPVTLQYWCYERSSYDKLQDLGPVESLLAKLAPWADKGGDAGVANMLDRLSQGDKDPLERGLGSATSALMDMWWHTFASMEEPLDCESCPHPDTTPPQVQLIAQMRQAGGSAPCVIERRGSKHLQQCTYWWDLAAKAAHGRRPWPCHKCPKTRAEYWNPERDEAIPPVLCVEGGRETTCKVPAESTGRGRGAHGSSGAASGSRDGQGTAGAASGGGAPGSNSAARGGRDGRAAAGAAASGSGTAGSRRVHATRAQEPWVLVRDARGEWKRHNTTGRKVLVISAGAGLQLNKHAYARLQNVDVVPLPAPHWKNTPLEFYDNKKLVLEGSGAEGENAAGLARLVCDHIRRMGEPPAVIICGSVGGQVTAGLVWRTCWRGPTVMLNAGSLRTQTPTYDGVFPVFVTMTGEKRADHPSFPHNCEVANEWFRKHKGDGDQHGAAVCVQLDDAHVPTRSLAPVFPSLVSCALARPTTPAAVSAAWDGPSTPVWLFHADDAPVRVAVGPASRSFRAALRPVGGASSAAVIDLDDDSSDREDQPLTLTPATRTRPRSRSPRRAGAP